MHIEVDTTGLPAEVAEKLEQPLQLLVELVVAQALVAYRFGERDGVRSVAKIAGLDPEVAAEGGIKP